jgi:hypothetical protein
VGRLGRTLPRGEALFVPFNCDVVIGDPIDRSADSREFVRNLQSSYEALFERCLTCKAEED